MRGDKEAKPPSEKKRKRRPSSKEAVAGAAVVGAAAGLAGSELLGEEPGAPAAGDPAGFDAAVIAAGTAERAATSGPGGRVAAGSSPGAVSRDGAQTESPHADSAETGGAAGGQRGPGGRPSNGGGTSEGDVGAIGSAAHEEEDASEPDDRGPPEARGSMDEFWEAVYDPSIAVKEAARPFDEGAITETLGIEDAGEAVDKAVSDVGRELGHAPDVIAEGLKELDPTTTAPGKAVSDAYWTASWYAQVEATRGIQQIDEGVVTDALGGEALEEVVDAVGDVHQNLVEALPEGTGDALLDPGGALARNLTTADPFDPVPWPDAPTAPEFVGEAQHDVEDLVKEPIGEVRDVLPAGDPVINTVYTVWQAEWDAEQEAKRAIHKIDEGAISDELGRAADTVADTADAAADAATGAIEDAGDAIGDAAEDAGDAAQDAGEDFVDAGEDVVEEVNPFD